MTITSDILKQAGFECVDRDKLCEKWELRTKWQTLVLFHNYKAYNAPYIMCGLKNSNDRFTVRDTQEIYDYAKLFGGDLEMKQVLQVFNESQYNEKMQARSDLLVKILTEICDATTDIECDRDNDSYIPELRYVPTFEFTAEDLAVIHRLAEEELQDFSMLTSTAITA